MKNTCYYYIIERGVQMFWLLGLFTVPLIIFILYWIYKDYIDPIREPTKKEIEERARKLKEKYAPKEDEEVTSQF
jgi:hypothetical protein